MADGAEPFDKAAIAHARPYLEFAVSYLTSATKNAHVPTVTSLLTQEGYDRFWDTCPDTSVRHRIYLAVIDSGLFREFGPPRAPGELKTRTSTPRQLTLT